MMAPAMSAATPCVLIVSTKRWPIPARVALALANAGFAVAAISPRRGFVSQTRAVYRHFHYRPGARASSIVRAIQECTPELLICTDDPSVKELHRIHAKCGNGPQTNHAKMICRLIERSLGAPDGFEIVERKAELLRLAAALGVRCPKTISVAHEGCDEVLERVRYPILVKADGSWGGKLVRIVEDPEQAKTAIRVFRLPSGWPTALREFIGRWTWLSAAPSRARDGAGVCLQEFVSGWPANRAVLCWHGRVLAGISVRVHKTVYTFGPASTVEIVDLPEMTKTVETLVRRLKLSGLIGFDFVLDSENRAWFIEMNPRVTPACYLRGGAADLAAMLYAQMTGKPSPLQGCDEEMRGLIALFPQEIQRSGTYGFGAAQIDVPWDDPQLVLALLKSAMKMGFVKRLGMRRQNRQSRLTEQSKDSYPEQPGRAS